MAKKQTHGLPIGDTDDMLGLECDQKCDMEVDGGGGSNRDLWSLRWRERRGEGGGREGGEGEHLSQLLLDSSPLDDI